MKDAGDAQVNLQSLVATRLNAYATTRNGDGDASDS